MTENKNGWSKEEKYVLNSIAQLEDDIKNIKREQEKIKEDISTLRIDFASQKDKDKYEKIDNNHSQWLPILYILLGASLMLGSEGIKLILRFFNGG